MYKMLCLHRAGRYKFGRGSGKGSFTAEVIFGSWVEIWQTKRDEERHPDRRKRCVQKLRHTKVTGALKNLWNSWRDWTRKLDHNASAGFACYCVPIRAASFQLFFRYSLYCTQCLQVGKGWPWPLALAGDVFSPGPVRTVQPLHPPGFSNGRWASNSSWVNAPQWEQDFCSSKWERKAAFLSALLTVSLGLLEAILPVSACRKSAWAGSHHKSRAQSGAKR